MRLFHQIRCMARSRAPLATAIVVVLIPLANTAFAQATAASVVASPPPSVVTWSPQSKVVAGLPITITGSSFNPAAIEVRLGGQKLFLISKSPTLVVARAPGGPGTRSATDFSSGAPLTVKHTNGQSRTLDAAYRVLDRWNDFQPRLLSMTISSGAHNGGPEIFALALVTQLTLAGLPGDAYDRVQTGPVAGSSCGQKFSLAGPPPKTYSGSPDGGTLALEVQFDFNPVRFGPCQLFLPLALHYQDNPGDVRIVMVNLGTHAIQDPRNVRRP